VRIGRPPQDRLLRRLPRKHAALVRGEEACGLEIAARGEQAGRLAQRLIQRGKPFRIGMLLEPDQPRQSCNSSSAAR
jgi:hypothetical protein